MSVFSVEYYLGLLEISMACVVEYCDSEPVTYE